MKFYLIHTCSPLVASAVFIEKLQRLPLAKCACHCSLVEIIPTELNNLLHVLNSKAHFSRFCLFWIYFFSFNSLRSSYFDDPFPLENVALSEIAVVEQFIRLTAVTSEISF